MSVHRDGIAGYLGRYAANLMGRSGVLDPEEEIPPEMANQMIMHFKDWLVRPALVKDPIAIGDLATYFDESFVTEGSV